MTGAKRSVDIHKISDHGENTGVDIHKPVIAGHDKKQEQAHVQKQVGESSRPARKHLGEQSKISAHKQLGEQAKQVVDLKSVESVESQVASKSIAVGGKAIGGNARTTTQRQQQRQQQRVRTLARVPETG